MIRSLLLLMFLIGVVQATGCEAAPQTSGQKRERPGVQLASVFTQVTIVQPDYLNEISGMVPAGSDDHVWTLNDSGGKSQVYRLDRKGKCVQTLTLKGIQQRDWEDLGRFRKDDSDYLVIADTGNNRLKHAWGIFHIVKEPALSDGVSVEVTPEATARVLFPDIRRDCEAIACWDGWVYLATKAVAEEVEQAASHFYRFPIPSQGQDEWVAESIGQTPLPLITAMDISSDGRLLMIRDYLTILIYQREQGQTWPDVLKSKPTSRFPGPFQPQAESICFSVDGQQVWTISEGENPVWWTADLKIVDTPETSKDQEDE